MVKQRKTKSKRGLVMGICAIVIIVALVGVIVYLLSTRNRELKEERRNVLVTQENAESVFEDLEKMEEVEAVVPGYYTVTMNTTWHFEKGSAVSYDAVVENVESNTNDVFFDIVLESDESIVLYKSPVIPRGGKLTDVALDEQLGVGTYPCVVIYHLIDENQKTLSTLRVALNIVVE